ncbi:Uncharacterised protein [Edwardsiella ictaluri]|nr:Uncharacterised protein [Edwardsiella ictaluri]STP88266.1 Uncharacterised protein [Edwardsiella ictaluri]STQ88871.1 Uncharacterised protein [Edwardsiella ictaluri]
MNRSLKCLFLIHEETVSGTGNQNRITMLVILDSTAR